MALMEKVTYANRKFHCFKRKWDLTSTGSPGQPNYCCFKERELSETMSASNLELASRK